MSIQNVIVLKEIDYVVFRHGVLEQADADDLPTLELAPEFPFLQTDGYNVLKSGFKDGLIIRRQVHNNRRRKFDLTWKNANASDRERLQDFYYNRRGGAGAFWWTPPDESTAIRVRFVEDTLTLQKRNVNNYQINVAFDEVL